MSRDGDALPVGVAAPVEAEPIMRGDTCVGIAYVLSTWFSWGMRDPAGRVCGVLHIVATRVPFDGPTSHWGTAQAGRDMQPFGRSGGIRAFDELADAIDYARTRARLTLANVRRRAAWRRGRSGAAAP